MALTFTEVKRINYKYSGGFRQALYDITFDASYATGGWSVTPANVGMTTIYGLIALGPHVAAAGAQFGWDPVNSKILAYKSNTAALFQEIAAGDLSTRVARFFVIGG